MFVSDVWKDIYDRDSTKRFACPTSLGHAKSVAMINFKIDSEIDPEHTNKKISYSII
jgi:hypothetical protein